MSITTQRGPARVSANLTPLIDVVFLLIVFFVLVAQITSAERVRMLLPRLDEARAADPVADRTLVVNVIPASMTPDAAPRYRVAGADHRATPEGERAVRDVVTGLIEREPSLRVVIRAARDERYEVVRRVMRAARDAGAGEILLVAIEDDAQ